MGKSVRFVLLALAVGLVAAAPAAADSNPAKELCKNGGYAGYTTAAGGVAFPNQGRCVSFVNHGGTLVPVAPPVTISELAIGTPVPGVGGCALVIEGAGFTGATAVTVNGTGIPFTVISDSEIDGTPAVGLQVGDVVTVTTPAGSASAAWTQTDFPCAASGGF